MIILTLLALLLTTPGPLDGPGDDTDGPGDDKDKRAQPLRVQPPPATDYALKNFVAPNGQVWVSVAYGVEEKYFDDDSDERELGAFSVPGVGEVDANGELSSLVLHIGGAYDISQIGDMNISVGADLGIVQREAQADAIPPSEARSATSPAASPRRT